MQERADFSWHRLPNGDVLGWWHHGERGFEFAGRNTFTPKGATLGENQPPPLRPVYATIAEKRAAEGEPRP